MVKQSYDEIYDIRLADYEEIDEIMVFINTYWKDGHILGTNRKFFEYEMVVDGQVNFIIAKRKDDHSIDGIYGFLPCSANKAKYDIWGVMWKTKASALPLLGMELKKRLLVLTGARTDLGVGANKKTSLPLLKFYGYYTAKMKHFYCLSSSADYKIANIRKQYKHEYTGYKTADVKHLDNIDELKTFFDFETLKSDIHVPYKDAWYFNRRFYGHPIYDYDVWGACGDGGRKAVIVTRKQTCNGSSAVRIVDYIGDQSVFRECGRFLDMLLASSEYVDFYFAGFEEEHAKAAGMVELDEADGNIIPDYFSPFQQTNVDIYVVGSDKNAKYTFYKADGDQDRPS